MKKLIFVLLFALTAQSVQAASFYKYRYFIQEGDSFKKILKRFTKKKAKLTRKTPMVRAIFKKNKHVKSWKNLSLAP